MPARLTYRVDGIEVDVLEECVRRNGRDYRLKSDAFRTLVYLINQRHRVVHQSDLTSYIWRDRPGSEAALDDALGEIRNALGDSLTRQQFVKNMPNSGYRFVSTVQEISDEAAVDVAAASGPAPATTPNVRLITGVVFALGTLISILIALAMSTTK